MRPLKLKLNGLRSYRTEQEIDFTDVDVMAIVGDTGAGKSSLLEAISVALYGCCTWDARSAKPLIADAASTLQVELTFRSGDQTWRVTRAISRGAYPPSVHLLESLDDGTRVDNADPVNAEIRRLIGLDFATFLKAVVLPQGRFQVLLQMSNTDRAPILKSILGLDQLTIVREHALTLAARLHPQLADLRTSRAGLLSDPVSAATDARARLTTANSRVAALNDAKRQIGAARAAETTATARAGAARAAADRIAAAAVDDADTAYKQLTALNAQLMAEHAEVDATVVGLQQQEHDLDSVLTSADAAGVGLAGLASAATSLGSLAAELPDLNAERARCDAEATTIARDSDALDTRRAAVGDLSAAAERAENDASTGERAVATAVRRVDAAQDALATARAAAQTAADASTKRTATAATFEDKDAVAAAAERDAEDAERGHATALHDLEAVQRANAAAHAASTSHAGELCPVCQRILPDDFVVPTPPGEEDAVAACTVAETRAKKLTKEANTAAANRDNTRSDLSESTVAAEETERARIVAEEDVERHLGPIEMARSDNEILAALQQAADEAATALDSTRAAAKAEREKATAAAAQLAPAEDALTGREKALADARRVLDRRTAKLQEAVAGLPLDYRPDEPLTVDALTAQLTCVEQAKTKLAVIAEQLGGVRKELATARAQWERIRGRRRDEIDAPASELRRRADVLADRAAAVATLLQEPVPPAHPAAGLAEEAAWARELTELARHLAGRCGGLASSEDAAAAQATAEAVGALASVDVADEAQLDELLVAAATDSRVADRELRVAEEQVPLAADLDGRIAKAAPFVESLDELARLLSDGKFVGAVVRSRQRALLGVASELLGSMTADRFGFADGFQIVDRLSGQPRDVKTLSGGETFLASLALALALVELAGRGGGRLEALFLDEGFASLDANSLTDALDALGRQAEGGRLVGLISHLRAVAENIEHVLVITKGAAGSDVHWLGAGERDELVDNALKDSLVS